MTGSAVAPAVATCCAGASSSSSSDRVNDASSSPSGGSVGSADWASARLAGVDLTASARVPPRRSRRPSWRAAAGVAAFLVAAAFLAGAGAGRLLGCGGRLVAGLLGRGLLGRGGHLLGGRGPLGGGGRWPRPSGCRRARALGVDHHGHSFVAEAAQHGLHPGQRDAGVFEDGPDVTGGDVPLGPSLREQALHRRVGRTPGGSGRTVSDTYYLSSRPGRAAARGGGLGWSRRSATGELVTSQHNIVTRARAGRCADPGASRDGAVDQVANRTASTVASSRPGVSGSSIRSTRSTSAVQRLVRRSPPRRAAGPGPRPGRCPAARPARR